MSAPRPTAVPFRLTLVVLLAAVAGCGSEEGTGPTLDCSQAGLLDLPPGAHAVIDPTATGGCVRIPPAGGAGAEYLLVAVSGAGQEAPNGVSGPYQLSGRPFGVAAAPPSGPGAPRLEAPRVGGFGPQPGPGALHDELRRRERELRPSAADLFPGPPLRTVPPQVGDKRSFFVCANSTCSGFVTVDATAKYVGSRGAIYLDDTVPPNGYTQADLDQVGQLFDDHMYPIDTTAFGRESDIDGNGVVVILLTDAVNALSGDCNSTGVVTLGYFFGLDLLDADNSNRGEVFYGLVPDPGSTTCTVSTAFAVSHLPKTFIHEFQHMIAFNQHVLVRGGRSEDTWLAEGLSHFAEELGGRLIPGSALGVPDDTLRSRFLSGNLTNGYNYLANVEFTYLVAPGSSQGELEERGAAWLFVRWLADTYGTDSLGTNVTRALVGTSQVGGANVAAVTGASFATLVTEWQMANYLDDLPGFSDPTDRLDYDSWNFRQVFADNNLPYPLVPDGTATGQYSRDGTLLAGSGVHVLVQQAANMGEIRFELTTGNTAALAPRFGVTRIR